MSTQTLEQRAADGARRFDEIRPGWFLEINKDRLDLGSPTRCIVGQLYEGYGSFASTYRHVARQMAGSGVLAPISVMIEYGLYLDSGDSEGHQEWLKAYTVLTAAWLAEIKKREAALVEQESLVLV